MPMTDRAGLSRRGLAPVAVAGLTALLAAGCDSSGPAAAKSSMSMPAAAAGESSAGMSGMNMGATPAATGDAAVKAEVGAAAGGVNPIPTQQLGTAVWQGMKITPYAMTSVPFLIYNGTTVQEVKPPKDVSFHLMVTLNDVQTNVVIPYASVWATITQGTKTPFDESLWPMISRYMGPHYGNNVVLPGAGTYQLTLLISPPVSARHIEYQDVWLSSHKVTFTFPWKQSAS